MSAEESSPAIILRARDYSESDRIVTALSRDFGKLAGIARGAKASRLRFVGRLEPFSHVVLYFRRRPHGRLLFITRADAGELTQFYVEDDLNKIALGTYMLELADSITTEEAEAHEPYRLLAQSLAVMCSSGPGASLRQAFELKLLQGAGFGLEFERCRICSRPNRENGRVFFVVARGGTVCPACYDAGPESGVSLDGASAGALARLAALPTEQAAQGAPAGADGALAIARFISSIIDRKLRSLEFLDSILPALVRPR
jgi:DNA repair protein RecO (recombination protein O)